MDVTAMDSPVGLLEIAIRDDALVQLEFVERTHAGPAGASGIPDVLRAYFAGDVAAIEAIPIRFERGTPFQHEVWHALRAIPVGETISYAELARRVDRPSAFRAVGAANGQNPIAVVVPCHRVIAADGTLGGYGGGLDRKRRLLAYEGAARSAAQMLPGLSA